MEPQRLQEIRSLIESFIVGAPYGRRLGVVLEELVEPDRVRIRLPYTEDNTTIADVVHGGAIASLVDVAATAACWASPRVAPGARGTTIGFAVNFLNARPRPGPDRHGERDPARRFHLGVRRHRTRRRRRARGPRHGHLQGRVGAGRGVRGATMSDRKHLRALVEGYARAKCRADVAGALAFCHPDFQLETTSFGLSSRDRAETAAHLYTFFQVFPDYHVEVEELAFAPRAVACWGMVRMTMRGDLLGVPATGRTAALPFVSLFTVAEGLLRGERFIFDLATLCEQLGISLGAVRDALAAFRAAGDAHAALAI